MGKKKITKRSSIRRSRTGPVAPKRLQATGAREAVLEPESKAKPPACADYGDAASVRDYEVAVRRYRAASERFRVRRSRDHAGSYLVTGDGAQYAVDIVDRSGGLDACACPDFASNDLGTCKHLEAVRRARAGRAADSAAPGRTITLAGSRLVAVGPQTAGVADALERGDLDEIVRRGWRVVDAADQHARALRERRDLAARTAAIDELTRTKRLETEVLSEPLFPYQRDGVLHLVRAGRALLADDMGLGKTVQAIAACEILRRRGEARRILIVTPASLKAQWAREIERYTGSAAVVVGGGARQRQAALITDAPYLIVNYELVWRDFSAFARLGADVVVLDEAQRAKNFRTKTAATLRRLHSRFLFVLTGTPVENRLDDLYSLLQLIDPGRLGPLWRFNLDFHERNPRGKIIGCRNLGALRERLRGLVLRRRKEEVLTQLPPLTEQRRYVALSPRQVELEEHYRREAGKLMAIAERRPLRKVEQDQLMASLLKARQACNAAELCDPSAQPSSGKLDEMTGFVEEIAEQGSAKILIFSEWTEMLRLAAARLTAVGVGHLMLHGGVPTVARPALLDRFRSDANIRVLLSTDAGGVGLNLQAASYVMHLDLPWNPARLDQRTARAHRLGQTRGVSVVYLCAETGIERGIEGTLAGKRALRSAALDPASGVEELDAPSFAAFLRQLRGLFVDGVVAPAATLLAAPPTEPVAPPVALPAGPISERLRLADVVLAAGFPLDAVNAAYQALAAAMRALLPEPAPPPSHAALVAEVYRTLIPSGRVPHGAHAILARTHDLAALAEHGVSIDQAIAVELVAEAKVWSARLVGGSATP